MFNLLPLIKALHEMNDDLTEKLDTLITRLDRLIEIQEAEKKPADGSHWDHGPHLKGGI